MNDGVDTTPEQAARSSRIVRLVSFGASAALVVVVLLGIAALRFSPLGRQDEEARVVLSEITREPQVQPQPREKSRVPPPPRQVESQQNSAPVAVSPPDANAASDPVIITDPVWITRPRNPERFYPREAFMRGVAGEVVLDCDVDTEGRLACVVVSETPAGSEFGAAALRIANAHVMRPAMRNGAPARGRYRMVVPFSPSG
ncbi:MAG: TonB family protein [Hyphomonadaceae bacterium]